MKIINPNEFYKLLITDSDISLYSKNHSKILENGLYDDYLNLEVFNKTGEWLQNQINQFNTEDDVEEITYGNFEYLGTVLDDTSYVVPQYTELFKLEILALEKDRELIIELFDEYAAELNNYQGKLSEEDNDDIYITLGEHSTPTYGEKQDIGGCERFLVSLSVLVRVSESVITTKSILLHVYNPDTDTYDKINYATLSMKRESDVILENKAGLEKTYDINKSDFTMSIGALYLDDYISKKSFQYLLDPSKLEESITIRYEDTKLGIETSLELYIIGMIPNIQFGSPISYTTTFKLRNK